MAKVMLAKECLSPRVPPRWGKKDVFPSQEVLLQSIQSLPVLPYPRLEWGVRCHWSMRTTILALESLVGGQLEDWQGPPANQGFLAGGPGHFCLFPNLLTFGNRPDKQTLQLHL